MMFILVSRAAIACLMLLMLFPAPGYSQETTGTILGTLVDQTGGVLPAVKVVITRVDTGQVREVVTNNVGQYTASLPIGNYEISFLLPKFLAFHGARDISPRQRSIAGQWQVDRQRRGGDADGYGGAARSTDIRGSIPDSTTRH
jgi:hypothetical protein